MNSMWSQQHHHRRHHHHHHRYVFCLVLLWRFFLFSSFITGLSALSSSSSSSSSKNQNSNRKIEKVAIIGAGISGLSLAHALENSSTLASTYSNTITASSSSSSTYGIETHIFDARTTLGTGGAGIQLTGGMAVLRKINPDLQEAVAKASVPLKRIKSFTKPWFDFSSTNKAWSLFEMNIEDCIRNANGRTEQELIVDNQVMSYSIMRSTLQDVLYQNLPEKCKDRVQRGKKLVDLASDEHGIMCLFEDGTRSGPFDLIVGCDGIRSTVKEFVETGKISSSTDEGIKKGDQSIYSGIKIQYAVQDTTNNLPTSSYPTTEGELCQYFGDGVYGLSGIYGEGENRPPKKAAFLIFRDDNYNGPFPKEKIKQNAQENVDWYQDEESLKESMIRRIQKAGVPSFQIEPVILDSNVFFELGVYFHNPLSFNGWSRKVNRSGGRFCVLCGDSAHAMPPFLGQGGNQAIQDAFVLATKIFEFNTYKSRSFSNDVRSNTEMSLAMMLREYESLRWNPTSSITAKSILLGYLETGGKGFPSFFRDAFFFVSGKIGVAQKVFLDAATPKINS